MAQEKPIRISGHAREQMTRRGATEAEVVAAIRQGQWGQADGGRRDGRLDIPFDAIWNGKHYAIKQVRPVFAEEPDAIVVVTVYVYYF